MGCGRSAGATGWMKEASWMVAFVLAGYRGYDGEVCTAVTLPELMLRKLAALGWQRRLAPTRHKSGKRSRTPTSASLRTSNRERAR
jgi:hypothetical protein